MQLGARLGLALLASAQGTEVLRWGKGRETREGERIRQDEARAAEEESEA